MYIFIIAVVVVFVFCSEGLLGEQSISFLHLQVISLSPKESILNDLANFEIKEYIQVRIVFNE